MSVPIHIAAGAEGLFWLFVVAVSIIAQIVKAGRRNQERPAPPPGAGADFPAAEPADELRQFLEKLAGAPPVERPPAPPPVAPPPVPYSSSTQTRPSEPSRSTAAAMRNERVRAAASRPSAVRPEPPPAFVAKPAMPRPLIVRAPVPGLPAQPAPVQTHELCAMLFDPAAIRKAILLREILGPPVALGKKGAF
jgi:hypothetical protein